MEQIFGKKLLAKDLETASKYSERVRVHGGSLPLYCCCYLPFFALSILVDWRQNS